MKQSVRPARRLEGEVKLPGDKSISQRAILLNSIADGTASVSNLCEGDDRTSILGCMRGLGVEIIEHRDGSGERFEVRGRGSDGLVEPPGVLDAGNSGTAARLVTGLLASQPFFSVLTGDESLLSRPMDRVIQPLRQMGADIRGRAGDSLGPLAVRGGGLTGIDFAQPVASAQVKSSLLIAGIHADGETTIRQPAMSRDHTERMMSAMGAKIEVNGLSVTVARSKLRPVDISVPGDISGAAFWLVAGAIHPHAEIRLSGVGINQTRSGVLEVLNRMGASISVENVREENDEPVADIVSRSSDLKAVEIGGDLVPLVVDELPALAVAASQASGTTVIADAAELRVKESDRISATVDGLARLGAAIEEREDGMTIRGGGTLSGTTVNSYGDHRIAMSMAVAGLCAEGETTIDGAEAAGVSYPGFWDTLTSISDA